MVDLRELRDLQARVREAEGYDGACTFFIEEDVSIVFVWYKNRIRTCLAFAEMARANLAKIEQGV